MHSSFVGWLHKDYPMLYVKSKWVVKISKIRLSNEIYFIIDFVLHILFIITIYYMFFIKQVHIIYESATQGTRQISAEQWRLVSAVLRRVLQSVVQSSER